MYHRPGRVKQGRLYHERLSAGAYMRAMMAPIPREVLEKIREAIENEKPTPRNQPIYLKYIWATSLEEAVHGTEMYGYFPRWPCGGHAVESRAMEDTWALEDDSYHLFVIPCKDKEEFDHLCWRDRVEVS